jgi:hypothetical protein
MSHVAEFRQLHPGFGAVLSKAADAYAQALSRRTALHKSHEEALRTISATHEEKIAAIPNDAEDRDVRLTAENKAADESTNLENNMYSLALEKLNNEVDELYEKLSPEEKGIINDEEPPVVLKKDTDAITIIAQYINSLPDTTKELIVDMNNMSDSTSIDIAVGYIPKSKFLRLPVNLAEKIYALWDTQPQTESYRNGLSPAELIAVAAVNLPCFEGLPGSEFLALLRAQTCAIIGAPRNTSKSKVRFHEVVEVPADTSKASLDRITSWMGNNQPAARNLRYFAINFVCLTNHVILSLRSHWKNDASFNNMWNNGLKGALMDTILSSFAYDRSSLFHDAIHPWGLFILYQSHKAFAEKTICDNSMKLRFTGAACGTAAFTGAAALLEQMKATKLFDNFFQTRSDEIVEVQTIAERIRTHRDQFNLNHRYYGHNDAPNLPNSSVKAIAPVLMAYRDVFLKNTSFKDIRAISKVAENADGVRKVLVEKMKTLVKDASTRVNDIV